MSLKDDTTSLHNQIKMLKKIRMEMERELKEIEMADMNRIYDEDVYYQQQMDKAYDDPKIVIKDNQAKCAACGGFYDDKQLDVFEGRVLCGFCIGIEMEHKARSYTGLE